MQTFSARWKAAAVGAALLVLVHLVVSCGARPGRAAKKTYPRAELRKTLVGKTQAEVREVLGKPDSTRGYDDGTDCWVYEDLSFDPVAEKVDSLLFVRFGKDGRVERVDFSS